MTKRVKTAKKKLYTPQEIQKAIARIWPRLAAFLKLEQGWDDFLAACHRKFGGFKGLRIRKTGCPACWSAGFGRGKERGRHVSYVYIDYDPVGEPGFTQYFNYNLCRELVHVFRGTIHQNQFKASCLVHYFLEEALCSVIATKALDERGGELFEKGISSVIEIAALEQILYSLQDEEIRRLAVMPRTEDEAMEVASLVMRWMSVQQYSRNYENVWSYKLIR